MKNTLNLYNVFGYLMPGFLFVSLPVIDYDLSAIMRYYSQNGKLNLEILKSLNLKAVYILDFFSTGTMSDFKIIPFIIFLFFCYLIGHIISAFSSIIFERIILKKTLKYPTEILFSEKPKDVDRKNENLFWSKYRFPFEKEIKAKFKTVIDNTYQMDVPRSSYFWLSYSYVSSKCPYIVPRIHHFVNLYGFSRNIAASIITYLFLRTLLLACFLGSPMDGYSWIVFGFLFLSAITMVLNYLKLFRRQAIDLFFAFLSNSEGKLIAYGIDEHEDDTIR